VTLHYGRTAVDWAGIALTVVGLLGLAGLAGWHLTPLAPVPPRRWRRRKAGVAPEEPSGAPEPDADRPSEEERAPLLT
jgi:hypothetical protein